MEKHKQDHCRHCKRPLSKGYNRVKDHEGKFCDECAKFYWRCGYPISSYPI